MARTATVISDAIKAKIAADPILSLLMTSASKTAYFNLLADIFGEEAHAIELDYDTFATELKAALLNQRVGSEPFYIDKSKLYQHGDTIIYEGDGKYGYATLDTDLQIIERVAVVVSGQVILLKVAKLVSSVVTPLTASEMAGFQSYWSKIDFVPSFLTFLSATADDIRFTFTATLNPQIFDTTTGELLIGGDLAVETAIKEFCDEYTDTQFDATFFLSELTAAVLQVNGVDNIVFSVAEAKTDVAITYTDILTAIGQKYNSYAGYFKTAVLTANYN